MDHALDQRVNAVLRTTLIIYVMIFNISTLSVKSRVKPRTHSYRKKHPNRHYYANIYLLLSFLKGAIRHILQCVSLCNSAENLKLRVTSFNFYYYKAFNV